MHNLNEYYQQVVKISKFIVELYNSQPDKCSIENRIPSAVEYGPNPFYSVISNDGTLLLQMGYFLPSHFHTPLGKFDFAGSGFTNKHIAMEHLETLKEKLGLVEVVPKSSGLWGEFGPIFAVTQDVDGFPFHLPDMPLAKAEISYEYNREEWRKIKAHLLASATEEQEQKQDENTSSLQP